MSEMKDSNPRWQPESKAGGEHMGQADTNIKLCPACKMSICWEEMAVCAGCTSGAPRPLSSKFLMRLREELARRDTTVVVRWLDGRGRVVHHGAVERAPGCHDKSRRAQMCNTLALYALKHGWAAWALDVGARELREPAMTAENGSAVSAYRYHQPIEDDNGPTTHWCSCGSQKLESSGQTQSLSSEVTIGILAGRPGAVDGPPDTASHGPTGEHLELAYERGVWAGATAQILADAIWLAGPGRRQIVQASGKPSQEVAKGSRGSVETVMLHYFFMNNHINTLDDGLEVLLLGTYLAALDHGHVRDSDFTAYASEVSRHASLGRWVIAANELVRRWPGIMDWHAGCLSTLGLIRGLELRAWVFACHWDVIMHYELGSGMDWEEPVSPWMYIAAALGHDAGDLCSDTRRGCVDNSYYAVGARAGYEGIAACMDIVCDVLEAVVIRDTSGAIDITSVAGSACATFERTRGELCACPTSVRSLRSCEAIEVLARVCGNQRIHPDDAASLVSMRDAVRSRCRELAPLPRNAARLHLDHKGREQVYADALRALATGNGTQRAHTRLQGAYSSAARSMCGELRRRAAYFRHCVGSSGNVLDLSSDCMCGGECRTWGEKASIDSWKQRMGSKNARRESHL